MNDEPIIVSPVKPAESSTAAKGRREDAMRYVLAVLTLASFVFLVWLFDERQSYLQGETIGVIIGYIGGVLTMAISYYFGSSSASSTKAETDKKP